MTRARRTALAAAALAAALTGCSTAASPSSAAAPTVSGPTASITPSASAAPSPTATPTPARTAAPAPVPTRSAARAYAVTRLPLSGRTIVLDPGHNALNGRYPSRANALVPAGGFTKPCNTTGTQTNAGYTEHAYTWAVAVRAAALLRAQGAHVVLTRPDDAGFGPCVNIRAAIANRNHAALTISLHADGGPAGGYGFHVIEPGLAPDHGNAAILSTSHRLALDLRSAFRRSTGEPYATYTASQGLARRSDLAGLNLARVPAVFIECGNMRNASDAVRLRSGAFQQRAAQGVLAAALAYVAGR
jgi:N-acetylmuramoyl-L-alanine amidase